MCISMPSVTDGLWLVPVRMSGWLISPESCSWESVWRAWLVSRAYSWGFSRSSEDLSWIWGILPSWVLFSIKKILKITFFYCVGLKTNIIQDGLYSLLLIFAEIKTFSHAPCRYKSQCPLYPVEKFAMPVLEVLQGTDNACDWHSQGPHRKGCFPDIMMLKR